MRKSLIFSTILLCSLTVLTAACGSPRSDFQADATDAIANDTSHDTNAPQDSPDERGSTMSLDATDAITVADSSQNEAATDAANATDARTSPDPIGDAGLSVEGSDGGSGCRLTMESVDPRLNGAYNCSVIASGNGTHVSIAITVVRDAVTAGFSLQFAADQLSAGSWTTTDGVVALLSVVPPGAGAATLHWYGATAGLQVQRVESVSGSPGSAQVYAITGSADSRLQTRDSASGVADVHMTATF